MNAKHRLFLGCFLALIATAFGFMTRILLIGIWKEQFGLDEAQGGRLLGIGVWPFAVSIIGFSLFIDKIGYKVAMYVAFLGHIIWAVMGMSAYFLFTADPVQNKALAYGLIYWGSLLLALANGTVEAFINPVVATVFSKEKTKWLNILHAGWPGGLVICGIIVIFMGDVGWGWKVGVIAAPAIVYLLMLIPSEFPVSERVASKVSYREMLSEFGVLGAAVVGFLVALQLMDFFNGVPLFSETVNDKLVMATWAKGLFWAIGAAIVIAFGAYTKSLGRPLMFVLILIMMPLATTEIGTDGWISDIMAGVFKGGLHAGWVLIYTSLIMMILRFCAGPIVHTLSPLGLLAVSAVLAIVGLYTLSITQGMMIFAAATLYGIGKTFFWPTMLGVVSEQCPKGGALTLNAISGIGMLAVGTLGFPYIGALQEQKRIESMVSSETINKALPTLTKDGKLTVLDNRSIYEIIHYQAIDEKKLDALVAKLPDAEQKTIKEEILSTKDRSKQKALANMTIFPIVMLVGYLILIAYFASKGGYKAQVLIGHAAEDKKYTGGVAGPMEA